MKQLFILYVLDIVSAVGNINKNPIFMISDSKSRQTNKAILHNKCYEKKVKVMLELGLE